LEGAETKNWLSWEAIAVESVYLIPFKNISEIKFLLGPPESIAERSIS